MRTTSTPGWIALVAPETTDAIGTDRDDPRFPRVPLGVEDSERLGDRVTLENLERDNEGVREEVGVHGRVEDVDRAVVRSREEQGVCGGERDGAQCTRVVSESLVRSRRKIEVVPDQPSVVGSDDQVVCFVTTTERSMSARALSFARFVRLTSEGVDVETRDPLESRVQSLDELLLHEIVDANVSLSLFEAITGDQRHASSLYRTGGKKGSPQQRSVAAKGGMRRVERHPSSC